MRRMIGVITVPMMSQAAATAEPQQIDLDVPSTTVAATVQINVKPSKGAVLLYAGPSDDKPIRFPGPSSTRVVLTSSRMFRIELVEWAKSFRVKIPWANDCPDGSKNEPSARLFFVVSNERWVVDVRFCRLCGLRSDIAPS